MSANRPADALEVAIALAEALGISNVEQLRSITLTVEAGEVPTVRIVRFIEQGEVGEVRELLRGFSLSDPRPGRDE